MYNRANSTLQLLTSMPEKNKSRKERKTHKPGPEALQEEALLKLIRDRYISHDALVLANFNDAGLADTLVRVLKSIVDDPRIKDAPPKPIIISLSAGYVEFDATSYNDRTSEYVGKEGVLASLKMFQHFSDARNLNTWALISSRVIVVLHDTTTPAVNVPQPPFRENNVLVSNDHLFTGEALLQMINDKDTPMLCAPFTDRERAVVETAIFIRQPKASPQKNMYGQEFDLVPNAGTDEALKATFNAAQDTLAGVNRSDARQQLQAIGFMVMTAGDFIKHERRKSLSNDAI
jgi:hypothetical protein